MPGRILCGRKYIPCSSVLRDRVCVAECLKRAAAGRAYEITAGRIRDTVQPYRMVYGGTRISGTARQRHSKKRKRSLLCRPAGQAGITGILDKDHIWTACPIGYILRECCTKIRHIPYGARCHELCKELFPTVLSKKKTSKMIRFF